MSGRKPVVQITPWVPPPPGNPLVLTAKVSGKGSYSFVNSDGFTMSKLMVTAKNGSSQIIGNTIEEKIDVSGWADESSNPVLLSPTQQALYEHGKTKTVIFEVVVMCQDGTSSADKITATEIFTKP
jgi:hypothetical protein